MVFLPLKRGPKLETLAFSCICGLLTVHLCGICYLIVTYALGWQGTENLSLLEAILKYSLLVLPGQLAVVCAVTLIAYVLRHLMFY